MEARNPSDEELWEACRKLPSDWEPHGQRRWHGREARPDCDSCKWFAELFRSSPDWGTCANPESERAGLLTHRELGCWLHEPMKERRYQVIPSARCDFMRRFEAFLREQAAAYIKDQVRRANGPLPEAKLPTPTPQQIRQAPLFVVIRRLLRHADEDFARRAFDAMAARARKDTRRYWQFAQCHWARTVGEDISQIWLPENMRELENEFWQRVDATLAEVLQGRESKAVKTKRARAG